MKGIPPNILDRLRTTLLDCGPFDSGPALRAAFVDARIWPWRDRLPQAHTRTERVDATVDLLHDKYTDQQENALVLFLRVLSERIDPGDACRQRLVELADELECAEAERITLPATVRRLADNQYEVAIPDMPGIKAVANDAAAAQATLAELVLTKVHTGKELAVRGHTIRASDTHNVSINVEITVAAPEHTLLSRPVEPFSLPTTFTAATLRFQSLFEDCFNEQSARIVPRGGPDHVERILEYLVRIARERRGPGADLSESEWEALIAAAWLLELERIGCSQIVSDWLNAAALSSAVVSLVSVDLKTLTTLPGVKTRGGKQLRLRLLGALLLLADSLDIDRRSVEDLLSLSRDYPIETHTEWWLRRYLTGVLIHSGKIGLTFGVPDLSYVPYLQIWLAGPLQRVFNLVSPVLIGEGWYLWMVSSTSEVHPTFASIPETLWQELTNEQALLSTIRPLVETLGGPQTAAVRPSLEPAPLTTLRQPPTALTWDLPPLPSGAHYEVELTEMETGTTTKFRRLFQPRVNDLRSVGWQPGGRYRWVVYRRWGGRRRDLAYGLFQISTPETHVRLSEAEAELPPKALAARRALWHAMGLYEDVISALLHEIQQGTTLADRLAARRELAETYDHLAQEARRRQLDGLADEYSALAAIQYRYLREFILKRKDS